MLVFELAIILLASKIAGDISIKLGQPGVLGKLLIGIILGPSVLGVITNTEVLHELSEIGVILLMFLAGLETDLDELRRKGKAASLAGVGGIVLPLAAGYLFGTWIELGFYESIFLGLLLSATSVSISVQTLREMNKLKSDEGTTILGAAIIDDVLVVLILAFLMGMAGGEEVSFSSVLLKKVVFFAAAILVAWKVVPWLMRFLGGLRTSETVISAALIICFLYAYVSDLFGVATIIGAYIAGVAISMTPMQHEVYQKTETISYSFFVPVFFTSIGVTAEFIGIGNHWMTAVILSIIAILTKLLGSGLGARLAGFNTRSSLRIGTGMISRGEVALIIASIGLQAELLAPWMFTVSVVVVLATTLVTPPLLKLFFRDAPASG
ncbi:cation:proton antiporter [Brevibacillus humidisoli]|uniref:cation:proton antiporter n=1 Tax=Brevibacillus humidisoli TaxID=2895522 RepID=UPI001E512C08|nr:cation:proton antiporter [Brevibacillus humidisoli]UFJ39665.1 cation:proton antiporter [Brevibacillus humidisoli]